MIETEITILINRKSDIEVIQQIVIANKIEFPVFILQYENHYKITFTSNYEEWELDKAFLLCFPGYEFTSDIENGKKGIRLQLSRYQSELSTDGWGRRIDNPLNEVKYLIKKIIPKLEKFSPKVAVLFGDSQQHYFINIVDGINKISGKEGFLLLNEFKIRADGTNTEILKDRLYETPQEAFSYGVFKMQELVSADYIEYVQKKKKEIRQQQKVPRKIIRDFITYCNNSEIESIIKNLHENLTFESRLNWQTTLRAEGINEFVQYIKSPIQELCSKNFKIRSFWDFNPPNITIGLKYFQTSDAGTIGNIQQYKKIRFELLDDKIINFVTEN